MGTAAGIMRIMILQGGILILAVGIILINFVTSLIIVMQFLSLG